jgi:hypothetical protein
LTNGGVKLRGLIRGGVKLRELIRGGVKLRELISGGVKLRELISGGVKLRELISGGVKLRELIRGVVKLCDCVMGVVFPEWPAELALVWTEERSSDEAASRWPGACTCGSADFAADCLSGRPRVNTTTSDFLFTNLML